MAGGGAGEGTHAAEVAQGRMEVLEGALAVGVAHLRHAAGLAQAVGDRSAESAALVALGHALLDMGLFRRARRRLADATALSRATEENTARRLSHVLRAATDLGERPGDRTAAAEAVDRLLPVLTGTGGRKGDFADALGFATWARATGVLGDGRAWERAERQAERRLDDLSLADRLRVQMALARGTAARGDAPATRALLSEIRSTGRTHVLLQWQAEVLSAALAGEVPGVPPDSLVAGLESDEQAAMASLRDWFRVT
jgi:hypothetical protein